MAAMDFDATAAPNDVVAALALRSGQTYTGQNASAVATLFIRETATPPAATARAFRIESGGFFTLTVSTDPIYLWTDEPGGCPVVIDEAA